MGPKVFAMKRNSSLLASANGVTKHHCAAMKRWLMMSPVELTNLRGREKIRTMAWWAAVLIEGGLLMARGPGESALWSQHRPNHHPRHSGESTRRTGMSVTDVPQYRNTYAQGWLRLL